MEWLVHTFPIVFVYLVKQAPPYHEVQIPKLYRSKLFLCTWSALGMGLKMNVNQSLSTNHVDAFRPSQAWTGGQSGLDASVPGLLTALQLGRMTQIIQSNGPHFCPDHFTHLSIWV